MFQLAAVSRRKKRREKKKNGKNSAAAIGVVCVLKHVSKWP